MSLHAAGEHAQPRVTYRFHSAADPDAGWQVVCARIDARISALYEATVQLVGEPEDDPTRLLGQSCTLEVRRGRHVRPLHGIVRRVQTARGTSGPAVEVALVPALCALSLGCDCRIFAEMSVPAVVEAVLAPALGVYRRSFEKRLRRADHPVREYVVQYRESDLAFVERLLAEEGIWYHFEHPPGRAGEAAELLCLVDDNDEALAATLTAGGHQLTLERDHAGLAHHEALTDLIASASLGASGVAVRAYNWTHPSVPAAAAAPGRPGPRAHYLPDEAQLTRYADGRYAASDASTRAALRWEQLEGAARSARATGNVIGVAPGQRIELVDPAGDGAARGWVVTGVQADGRDSANAERTLQHLEDFQCTLALAAAEHPVRPPVLPKPRVLGAQTGRVVGPDGRCEVDPGGDDIHVDEHGRVRVKLSWDRSGPEHALATVTCFLRVAQPWAGRGFGVHFTPRIGMEVVVSFLDGDPDRPLITGCVYNGLNEPPFRLPAQKTESGIRTQSTPSGEGHNALCFDDASGRERITLHAQRDHVEQVGGAQSVRVRGQRSLEVGGNELAYVSGDRATVVKGSEQFACAGSRSVRVAGDDAQRIGGEQVVEVDKHAQATFAGGRTAQVARSDRLTVTQGGDKDDHIEGSYRITADRALKLVQDAATLVMQSSEVRLENPGFQLVAGGDGAVTLAATRSLTLEVGKARITLSSDGSVEVDGVACSITGASGALTLSATEATLAGATAKVTGQTLIEIAAPLVKIN